MSYVTCMLCKFVDDVPFSVLPAAAGWMLVRNFGWICPGCAEAARAVQAIADFLLALGGG